MEEAMEASAAECELILLYDASISARLEDLEAVVAAQRVRRLLVIGLDGSGRGLLLCAGLGVPGLLSRDASLDQLFAAVDAVAQGGVFMSPSLRDALVRAAEDPGSGARAGTLTPRERDVASLVAAGLSNKQIACALRAAEGTIKIHVRHVMAKLDVNRRVDVGRVLDCSTGIPAMSASQRSERGGRRRVDEAPIERPK